MLIAPVAAPLQIIFVIILVEVNGVGCVITTVSSTLAANAKTSFTVNNDLVVAGSRILVSAEYDEAATGIPVLGVSDIANGSFKVVISNGAGVAALNNVVKVHYIILN